MKIFMVCAVEQTIMPNRTNDAPIKATYRRPRRSESDPTEVESVCLLFEASVQLIYRRDRRPPGREGWQEQTKSICRLRRYQRKCRVEHLQIGG